VEIRNRIAEELLLDELEPQLLDPREEEEWEEANDDEDELDDEEEDEDEDEGDEL